MAKKRGQYREGSQEAANISYWVHKYHAEKADSLSNPYCLLQLAESGMTKPEKMLTLGGLKAFIPTLQVFRDISLLPPTLYVVSMAGNDSQLSL